MFYFRVEHEGIAAISSNIRFNAGGYALYLAMTKMTMKMAMACDDVELSPELLVRIDILEEKLGSPRKTCFGQIKVFTSRCHSFLIEE